MFLKLQQILLGTGSFLANLNKTFVGNHEFLGMIKGQMIFSVYKAIGGHHISE